MGSARGLERRVAAWLHENDLSLCGKRVLVMCSGGIDSVTLVNVLATLPRGAAPAGIGILFCDHGLRDASADLDAAQAAADKFRMKLFRKCHAAEWGSGSLQAHARTWRYDAAIAVADEHGFDVVCTAHHASDNLESLVLGLVSSSGIAGMRGVSASLTWGTHQIVRPLLSVPRSDIETFARQSALTWAEDPTNCSLEYQRNRVRHEVVPALHAVHPGAGENIIRTHRQLSEQADVVTALSARIVELSTTEPSRLPIVVLSSLPESAANTVIAGWLRENELGRGISTKVINSIRELAFADNFVSTIVSIRSACVVRDRYDLILQRRNAHQE